MLYRVCYVTVARWRVWETSSRCLWRQNILRPARTHTDIPPLEWKVAASWETPAPCRAEMLSWAAPVQTQDTPPPPTLQLTTLCAETQAKQGADRKWSVTRQHLPLLDRALLVRYLWTSSGDWDHCAQDRTLHYNPLPALYWSVCFCYQLWHSRVWPIAQL